MKIIKNNLYCHAEQWDDPGDYPNAVAGSSLRSELYCEFGGEFIFEAENDSEIESFEDLDSWIYDYVLDECEVYESSPHLEYKLENNCCTVKIKTADVRERDDY